MLLIAADFYLNVIHMVQKMVGPGCCILAAEWNWRMEMAEAVFVDTTLHFTNKKQLNEHCHDASRMMW